MKIAVAGMHHESNTFNPIITGKNEFLYYKGEEVYEHLEAYASARGIFEYLRPLGYELFPAAFIRAVPNGVVSKAFYLEFKKDALERIAAAGRLDGIVLALHGSMKVEGLGEGGGPGSAESDFLEALRAAHPGVPITASLDMHATITDCMLRNADGFVGYKTAPHVDMYETGFAAARLMDIHLRTGKSLRMASRRVPILIAGEQTETSSHPTVELINLLKKEEGWGAQSSSQVLAASYLLGFPWADAETNGVTALTVTLDDQAGADRAAKRLASAFWDKRYEFKFHTEARPVAEALSEAFSSAKKPVFVSDSGDNPTAGSTGDSTHFLRELLSHPGLASYRGKIGYGGFYDPESLARCRGKVGQRVRLELGGKFDKGHGGPVGLDCEVIAEAKAWGHYGSDLVAVRAGKLEIVISEKHIGFGDEIDYWMALGLDPANYELLCLKLGYLTEIYFPYEPRSILALSEGASNELLARLPYKRLSRPAYPLDDGFSYEP
jgi:microcystin degradation protein MlrC